MPMRNTGPRTFKEVVAAQDPTEMARTPWREQTLRTAQTRRSMLGLSGWPTLSRQWRRPADSRIPDAAVRSRKREKFRIEGMIDASPLDTTRHTCRVSE